MSIPWKLGKKPYERQEIRTGKKRGARKQPNSGRVWSALGDVRRRAGDFNFLYDNKTTDSGRYGITAKHWRAFRQVARRTPPDGNHPVLQIDLGEIRLVVIEESTFDAMLDRLAE